MYRLDWYSCSTGVRSKYFTTVRKLRAFERTNALCMPTRRNYYVWDGSKYERFVFLHNKVTTKGMLKQSLVDLYF